MNDYECTFSCCCLTQLNILTILHIRLAYLVYEPIKRFTFFFQKSDDPSQRVCAVKWR